MLRLRGRSDVETAIPKKSLSADGWFTKLLIQKIHACSGLTGIFWSTLMLDAYAGSAEWRCEVLLQRLAARVQ